MTMAPQRPPEEALPLSARERAILFALMAEMEIAAIPDSSQAPHPPVFRAPRSQRRSAVARLARSRRPGRAAKSP
jgi:hypothetical protein